MLRSGKSSRSFAFEGWNVREALIFTSSDRHRAVSGAPRGEADDESSSTAPTEDDGVSPAGARARAPGLVSLFPVDLEGVPITWRLQTATALVGRSRGNAVLLNDTRVSRNHAELTARAVGLFVRDLGSKLGSFIDGRRVPAEGALAPFGSIVRFGNSLMLVSENVDLYQSTPRRHSAATLRLPEDVVAGPLLGQVWDQATRVAQLASHVLILGESGSGKEAIARIVHCFGSTTGPFVGINVAAIPANLFEAELFGYERGAFTGATIARSGAFREASGGVLFLDEIGELRPDLQVKLLRAIDLRCVRSLGATRDTQVEVRIVAATNVDLNKACEEGTFRTDLYFRLAENVIRVPALRERHDDIMLLARTMLETLAPGLRLGADAAERLLLAPWPGNARSLRHAIAHAIGQATDSRATELSADHLPDLGEPHEEQTALTEDRIRHAMTLSSGVASRAARELGVSRTTLYNALKRLNIETTSLRAR